MKKMIPFLTYIMLLVSCTDDVEILNENQAIIGKFQAHSSFSVKDPNAQPVASYEWSEVENGFTFELKKDGYFTLTKYDECFNGNYIYDDFSNVLTLEFDCPISINGENFTTIQEEITVQTDKGFTFWHEFNRSDEQTDIASTMLRIE